MTWLTASKTNSTTLSVTCAVHTGRYRRTGHVTCTSSPNAATAVADVIQTAAKEFIEVTDPGSARIKNIAASATSVTLVVKTNGQTISWAFTTPSGQRALTLTPVSCSIGQNSHTFTAAEISAGSINISTCSDFGSVDYGLTGEFSVSFVFSCSANTHASTASSLVTFTESPGGDDDFCTVRQAGANATITIENTTHYTFPDFSESGGTQTATVATNDSDWSPQASED